MRQRWPKKWFRSTKESKSDASDAQYIRASVCGGGGPGDDDSYDGDDDNDDKGWKTKS